MEVILDNKLIQQLSEICKTRMDFKKDSIELIISYSKLDIDFLPQCINNIIQEYHYDISIINNFSISFYLKTIIIKFSFDVTEYYSITIKNGRTFPILDGNVRINNVVIADDLILLFNTFMFDKYGLYNFIKCYSQQTFIKRLEKYKYEMYHVNNFEQESAKQVSVLDEIKFESIIHIIKQILLACQCISP